MKYSKDDLSKIDNPYNTPIDNIAEVISDLLNKLDNSCDSLSLAEKDWICSKINILYDNFDRPLDPYDFACCEQSIFYDRYLWYFNNLEGLYPVKTWKGVITGTEKERDIQMLEKHHQTWKQTVELTNHSDGLIQNVATETRHQIKEIKKYCKNEFLGSKKEKALIKSTILNSKYVFRFVQAYYQENPKVERYTLDGKDIVIDSFGYIHILFRHYGQMIKEHQLNKSYHIEGLDHKNLPKELISLVVSYSKISSGYFDGQKIYLKINNKFYGMWFREFNTNIKGGGTKSEFKLQTFYPVEDVKELKKIKDSYGSEIEADGIIFLLNN